MGSLGEEDELEKLVLDYIELSSPIKVSDHNEKSSKALNTLQEILDSKEEVEKEIEEKIKLFIELSYERDDEKRDVMKKIVSKLRSDGYKASLCKTSWDSSFDHLEGCRVFKCTRKYEYIDVMVTNEHDGDDVSKKKRVIIDLDFRSQFELKKQTEAYRDVTEKLMKVFVAREERLRRVVSLVCNEMKKSMKEMRMCRPPWRTSRYMQAKWLPENCVRVSSCKRGSWSWFDGDDHEEGEVVGSSSLKSTCCFPIF